MKTWLRRIKLHRSLFILTACAVVLMLLIDTKPLPQFVDAPVIALSTDFPEEKLPQQVGYEWRGRENDPKNIIIPSLGIDALIQNVGVDQNQQIAVPNNIHIAGWFVDSVRPGEKGLSIIDGHVNGQTSDEGVFKNIPQLQEGDTVDIVFGDDSVVSFQVRTSRSVSLAEAGDALFSQIPDISRQLNLITCAGNYDTQSRTYDTRHIVTLEAI